MAALVGIRSLHRVFIVLPLALPSPCLAPIVFVASPTGSWFAVTGG